MQKALIIGEDIDSANLLELLRNQKSISVQAVVHENKHGPAITYAKDLNIKTISTMEAYLLKDINFVFEMTSDSQLGSKVIKSLPLNTVIISRSAALLFIDLLQESKIEKKSLKTAIYKQLLIFDSIEEGMIGINEKGEVDFFNESASLMTGIEIKDAVGKSISEVIPSSRLLNVFKTEKPELHQELILGNGLNIVTSRYPLFNKDNEKIGAFAIFKELTEFIALAEEITDLEKVRTMLEAIIYSSDDAISVVDEFGNGLLINPAYTRITGLSEADVIGKPASADISEGESMHMKVLQTRKSIRGVNMFVGPHHNDVVVNVAPIIVDDKIRGSVGVIHDMTEIRNLTRELDQAKMLIQKLESTYSFKDVYGNSKEIELAIAQAKLAAQNDMPVLLRGEFGTGKDLFAHAIHNESARSSHRFIRVKCSLMSPSQLESQLFGVVSNEKLDLKRNTGLFIESDRGTLFLDEIADLPLLTQKKIMHYIKEGEINSPVSNEPLRPCVKIVTATAKNLEQAMNDGLFSKELYYELSRISIQIPSLRSRKEDIMIIVNELLAKLNEELGMNIEHLSSEAQQWLKQYNWPGNVRELENILSRVMIYMDAAENSIELANIKKSVSSLSDSYNHKTEAGETTLATLMSDHERSILESTIQTHDGNKSEIALALGISLRSLYYKLEKFKLL